MYFFKFQALARIKQEAREKESLVKEKIKFLESEIGNNAEYEKKISIADRKVLKCRMEYQHHETNRTELKDEVCQLKRLVCLFMRNYCKNKHKGSPLIKELPSSALCDIPSCGGTFRIL